MPRVKQVPPLPTETSTDATRGAARRKHPLLLALVASALVLWLGFLAYLAIRG
jgi:hypothetical protein